MDCLLGTAVATVDNTVVDGVAAGYDPEPWHDLYVMVGGAAGALAGLLFVAVSINLDRIIGGQGLARRAGETLVLMVGLLVLSVLVLTPQPRILLACESVVLGVVGFAFLGGRLRSSRGRAGPTYRHVVPAVILGSVAVPILLGGISLLAEVGGGLYWFVPALVLGFAGAVLNAWVLLVEILR